MGPKSEVWLVSHLSSFLPESSGDVVFGVLLFGFGEQLLGVTHLDQVALIEEGGHVADTGRLLHVVSDDDDRVVRLELEDQVFDA